MLTMLMNLELVVVIVEAEVVETEVMEANDLVVTREPRATLSVATARRRATTHESGASGGAPVAERVKIWTFHHSEVSGVIDGAASTAS